jgi:hypothetical protein
MGYHVRDIPRGIFGEPSKIVEECLEFQDAIEQNNKVMALVELADLIGAIEAYAAKSGITLEDLVSMKDATKRAFEDGTRTDRNTNPTFEAHSPKQRQPRAWPVWDSPKAPVIWTDD